MNIQKMMKQAQEMQAKLGSMQTEMEAREFEGAAGGGAVKITLTGKGKMTKIALDASLLNADEKDMLEDLIMAATNEALRQIDEQSQASMSKITGGLGGGLF